MIIKIIKVLLAVQLICSIGWTTEYKITPNDDGTYTVNQDAMEKINYNLHVLEEDNTIVKPTYESIKIPKEPFYKSNSFIVGSSTLSFLMGIIVTIYASKKL